MSRETVAQRTGKSKRNEELREQIRGAGAQGLFGEKKR